jgi:hypothetical protein
MMNQDTLSATLEVIAHEMDDRRIVLARPCEMFEVYSEPMRYNEVRDCNLEVATLKGKPTRKYAHVVIERLDSGRYEPILYVL